MGIMNLLEEGAGAFAADKGLEAVDPNANLLEKGLAAVAGAEGVNMLKGALGGGSSAQPQAADGSDQSSSDQSDDSQDGN